MNVIRLNKTTFCNTSNKVLNTVYKLLEENKDKKIYVLGSLLHNQVIQKDLINKGIIFIKYDDELIDNISKIQDNSILIFSAHGYPKKIINILASKDIECIDTTCPIIEKTYTFLNYFKDRTIVVVGKQGHDEIKAILDNYPNVLLYDIENKIDFSLIQDKNIIVTSQTSIMEEQFDTAINNIKRYAKEALVSSGICTNILARVNMLSSIPTTKNTIIIVGDETSSNTTYLLKKAKSTHSNSSIYRVNKIEDLKDLVFEENVYLIASTSALVSTLDEIEEYLKVHY